MFFAAGESIVMIPAKRLKNFYKSIAEHKDVAKIAMMLSSAVNSFRQEITTALGSYGSYHFLWEQNKEEICKVWRVRAHQRMRSVSVNCIALLHTDRFRKKLSSKME